MGMEKTSFLEDSNSTGFCVLISFGKGEKTHISYKGRTVPGGPLKEVSIDDASDAQLNAVCNVLDNL